MAAYYQTKYLPRRRKWGVVALVATVLVLVGLLIGGIVLSRQKQAVITLPQSYYFLVRECEETTATAVAGDVYLSGGAGLLIETESESSVVLACYFSQTDADAVSRSMQEKGVETKVLAMAPAQFKTSRGVAEQADRIVSNAKTVDSCARILYDTANGLERATLTQQEARAAVRGVSKALKGLSLDNGEGAFQKWNALLQEWEKRGREIAEGILFAKDLRYLQAKLCLSIVDIKNYF